MAELARNQRRPRPAARSTTFACGVLFAVLLTAVACNGGDEGAGAERTSPRLVELEDSTPQEQPGLVVVAVLDDLSNIFEQHTGSTEEGLAALRTYIQSHRQVVTDAVAALEKRQLDLPSGGGDEYVDPAQVREAMTRFARAQQAFRGGATEAQRVELSEILNSLQ